MTSDNPFAALAALKSQLPPGEKIEAAAAVAEVVPDGPMFAKKVIVSRQKKGRGGKLVTLIRGVLLPEKELSAFAKRLRKELGCAGFVEGESVVLSGDQTQRVEPWLLEQGAKKVIVNR